MTRRFLSARTTLFVWLFSLAALALIHRFSTEASPGNNFVYDYLVTFFLINSFLVVLTFRSREQFSTVFLISIVHLELVALTYYVIIQITSSL